MLALCVSITLASSASMALAGCDRGPRATFDAEVVPVLEERCATAACHGLERGAAAPEQGLFFGIDESGRLSDRAAAHAAALARVTTELPAASSLTRVPLPAVHGGGPHAGGAMLGSRDDPAYVAIVRWISTEARGGEDLELDALERRFGDEVLPVLVARCGFAGCHGPRDVANAAIPARRDPASGAFAPGDVRAARRAMRAFIDLWGADVTRSRLVRKAIGAGAGGIAHRGGPSTFFPEAPLDAALASDDLAAVLGWASAERAALGVADGVAPAALIWVRAPIAHRAPYRVVPEPAGSDMFMAAWPLDGTPAENLTASLHPEGPVEIRDPAVSHDARAVTFAMRRAGEDRFALWQLELSTRRARRLTGADAEGSFVQPVHGPDGRVIAVWDDGRDLEGEGAAPELVAIDADGASERLTYTRAPEVRPGTLASGKTRGMIVFGTTRAGSEGVLFRFPNCHDATLHGEPEYHVQFGASIAPAAPLLARELPDGRQVLLLLSGTGASDDRGSLALLDRSIGPMLRDGEPAAVGGWIPSLTEIDPAPSYRDPAALPDGTIIASSDREGAPGQDAIVRLAFEGGELEIDTLVTEAGWSLRSAAIVMVRPLEDDGHAPAIDRAADHARIAIRDATILEALYGRPQPTGPRVLRDDLAAVRVLAPARTSGRAGPGARVLAEVPLASDHSAELRIPARTPVLLRWIDARGMATGNQLDRWFYGEGLEVVPAGTNPTTYAHDCAGCHGALTGRPEDASAPPPDAISAASITLSTHEGRDRRRPIEPFEVPRDGATVTFERDLGPILDARCAGCHVERGAAPELTLDGARASYDALFDRELVDLAGSARRSALVERLLGEELDAPAAQFGRCPPTPIPSDELATVIRWIESGAAYREEP